MIELHKVTKRYPGGHIALRDVSFGVTRGEFVFLTGASGAGKTSLLKLVFRAEVPNEGQIVVNGRNVATLPRSKIPFLRRSIGVVFQDFRLIPRKTVFENVAYLPRILGMDSRQQKRLAYQTLRQVGLAHRMNDFPLDLSGGEQQRVAIARALINEPEIVLADEPTGNLDPDLSEEIFRLFLEINLRGTTMLIATHDRDIIRRVGGRVVTLDAGRIVLDERCEGAEPVDLHKHRRLPGAARRRSPADEPAPAAGERTTTPESETRSAEGEGPIADSAAAAGARPGPDGEGIDPSQLAAAEVER